MNGVSDYRKLKNMNPRKMSLSLQDVTLMNDLIDNDNLNSTISLSFSDLINLRSNKKRHSFINNSNNNNNNNNKSISYESLRNINSKKYKHVQSKVKDYIKQIKRSNDKQKMETINSSTSTAITSPISLSNDDSLPDVDILISTIETLKDELNKKDDLINKLQESNNNLLKKYNESETRIDRLRFESIENLSTKKLMFNSPLINNRFSSISDNNLNIINKNTQQTNLMSFEKHNKQNEENLLMNNNYKLFNGTNQYHYQTILINKSIQTDFEINTNTSPKNLIDCVKEIEMIVECLGKRSDEISQLLNETE